MQTVKLSTNGQFVIPNEIRKAHHLTVGTEFAISFVGDEIRLTPLTHFSADHGGGCCWCACAARGEKSDEKSTRAKIGKTLKARDAATRA